MTEKAWSITDLSYSKRMTFLFSSTGKETHMRWSMLVYPLFVLVWKPIGKIPKYFWNPKKYFESYYSILSKKFFKCKNQLQILMKLLESKINFPKKPQNNLRSKILREIHRRNAWNRKFFFCQILLVPSGVPTLPLLKMTEEREIEKRVEKIMP